MLEHHAEMPSDGAGSPHDVVTEHPGGALGGFKQRGEDLEERRLPATVRAKEADDLAAAHLEGDAVEGEARPVAMRDAAELDGR